jgi:hypothetical protein
VRQGKETRCPAHASTEASSALARPACLLCRGQAPSLRLSSSAHYSKLRVAHMMRGTRGHVTHLVCTLDDIFSCFASSLDMDAGTWGFCTRMRRYAFPLGDLRPLVSCPPNASSMNWRTPARVHTRQRRANTRQESAACIRQRNSTTPPTQSHAFRAREALAGPPPSLFRHLLPGAEVLAAGRE